MNNSTAQFHADSTAQNLSEAFRIVHLIISIVLTVVGITANALVICVVAATKKLHNTMSAFVVNMSVADLLSCSTTLAISCSVIVNGYTWPYDQVACDFAAAIHIISRCTANFSLTLLATDRCLAIWMSLRYSSIMTKKVAASEILIVWILGIVIACLPLITGQGYHFNPQSVICTPHWTRDPATTIVIHVLGICVPLVMTVISYSSIGYVAVKQAKRGTLVCDENNCHFVPNRKKELKVLKTPLCVTGVAIVCWTPYLSLGMWSLSHNQDFNFYNSAMVEMLSKCTIPINPILYMTLYQPCKVALRSYRRRVYEFLQTLIRDNATSTSTTTNPSREQAHNQSDMVQEISNGTQLEIVQHIEAPKG